MQWIWVEYSTCRIDSRLRRAQVSTGRTARQGRAGTAVQAVACLKWQRFDVYDWQGNVDDSWAGDFHTFRGRKTIMQGCRTKQVGSVCLEVKDALNFCLREPVNT